MPHFRVPHSGQRHSRALWSALVLGLLIVCPRGARAQVRDTVRDTAAAAVVTDSAPAVADSAAVRAGRVEAAGETVLRPTPLASDSAPVGTLRRGAPVRVLGRADGWVRVQVEAWVREADLRAGSGAALTGVTAAEVRAAPERYVGQTVDWRLQAIAVQVADDLRPEMLPGQRYLLARGPLPEAGFVYVTLSAEQAERIRSLPPLAEIVTRVRIRAARTRYLETPVVDFVALVSSGGPVPR